MAQDLLNRHPVDIWPSDGYPENHGAAPPGHTDWLLGNWGRLEGQLGHWAAGGTGSAIPRHCRGTALQNTSVRASTARPLSHPVLPLWLRAAINTAQQDGAPWQLQNPGESTLQQPCWGMKCFFWGRNLKSRNSQEKETVSMKGV